LKFCTGIGTATTAAQISAGGVADDSLIQNQVRLQAAAAAAASLYEKSFTYPSANTPVWYALLPSSNIYILINSMCTGFDLGSVNSSYI
jgi:hypothetical protein